MDQIHEIGGKAAGLVLLEKCGCRVPAWGIVPSSTFRSFIQNLGLQNEIDRLLRFVTAASAEATSRQIRALFGRSAPTSVLGSAVMNAYASAGGEAVAIRSSAVDEDGMSSSFAGVHSTHLNVRSADGLVDHVIDVWLSAYSPEALTYRSTLNLHPTPDGMAVIIQAMVDATRSGVLFTANPMSGSRQEMVLSAVYGLGEGLVSGAVDADTLVIDWDSGRMKSTHIGDKAEAYQGGLTEGVVAEPVGAEGREALALNEAQIHELCRLGRTVEAAAGCPQDIEWAIDADGVVWLVQSRPLTTLEGSPPDCAPGRQDGEFRIWDNSNILESFGSVTAPMTFSFARYAYYRAFQEYVRLLGIPRPVREGMEEWLPNMLGIFDGHVYYNLLNWYKMIRLLPNYTLNRKILELSMGLSEPLPDDVALAQVPMKIKSSVGHHLLRAHVFVRFLFHFVTIERSVDKFLDAFYGRFDSFESRDLATQSSLDVYRLYQELEVELLPRFGRMVILEAVISMSFGALEVLTKRWLPDAPTWFTFEAVRPNEQIESTDPADRLAELAQAACADPNLAAELNGDPQTALDRLAAAGYADFLTRVDDYIRKFGYRSANELKLEEPDMREDPAIFFRVLSGMMQGLTDKSYAPARDTGSADLIIRQQLRGTRKFVYQRVRSKVRRSLRARESVRFCRSRAFGMVGQMMKAIGRDMHALGAIADERDIFFIELEELRAYMEGRGQAMELREMIAIRRRNYGRQSLEPGPARFETRGVPYWGQPAVRPGPPDVGTEASDPNVLVGTACVPGIAEGEVSVVSDPASIAGEIVATYRTDPGWITVLPAISGLLIERGSPLTHVAIAAREFGVPTVVQIPELTNKVTSGDRVRVDGTSGQVQLLARKP